MMTMQRRLQLATLATVLAIAVLLGLIVALMYDAASLYGYTRGEGVAENLPLSLLGLFDAFTWMPALMPLLIPFLILLVMLVAVFVYPVRYVRHSVEQAAEHEREHEAERRRVPRGGGLQPRHA